MFFVLALLALLFLVDTNTYFFSALIASRTQHVAPTWSAIASSKAVRPRSLAVMRLVCSLHEALLGFCRSTLSACLALCLILVVSRVYPVSILEDMCAVYLYGRRYGGQTLADRIWQDKLAFYLYEGLNVPIGTFNPSYK